MSPLMMRHPYFGHLVTCAEFLGDQHPVEGHQRTRQYCWGCDSPVLTCDQCAVNIECCPCGEAHAVECPWPL